VPVVRTYACARACVFVGVCSARVTVDAPRLPWSISAQNCAKRYHVQFDAKIAICILYIVGRRRRYLQQVHCCGSDMIFTILPSCRCDSILLLLLL